MTSFRSVKNMLVVVVEGLGWGLFLFFWIRWPWWVNLEGCVM